MTGLAVPSQPIDGAEMRAHLAHATLSGPVGHPMVARFFKLLLPVLNIVGSILIELFTDGKHAEIGRRLAEEVRLLREQLERDVGFLARPWASRLG